MPVKIHGRDYRTVAERVELFHQDNKDVEKSITTEILHNDESTVMMKTTVTVNGSTYTGHAVEVYNSSMINKTSALENCETSAIGRALASAGLGGTEFASADEVTNAISQQNKPAANNGASTNGTAQETNTDDEIDWEKGRENSVPFGKHKGEKWKDLPLDYLKWMAEKSDNAQWKSMANAEVMVRITKGATEQMKENEKQMNPALEESTETKQESMSLVDEDDDDLPF
tara:strand:+ start:4654 stop:5340 length:687 start_codon:yes stop_codon:yes gene_type:complete